MAHLSCLSCLSQVFSLVWPALPLLTSRSRSRSATIIKCFVTQHTINWRRARSREEKESEALTEWTTARQTEEETKTRTSWWDGMGWRGMRVASEMEEAEEVSSATWSYPHAHPTFCSSTSLCIHKTHVLAGIKWEASDLICCWCQSERSWERSQLTFQASLLLLPTLVVCGGDWVGVKVLGPRFSSPFGSIDHNEQGARHQRLWWQHGHCHADDRDQRAKFRRHFRSRGNWFVNSTKASTSLRGRIYLKLSSRISHLNRAHG